MQQRTGKPAPDADPGMPVLLQNFPPPKQFPSVTSHHFGQNLFHSPFVYEYIVFVVDIHLYIRSA